jgi:hypothetical protein
MSPTEFQDQFLCCITFATSSFTHYFSDTCYMYNIVLVARGIKLAIFMMSKGFHIPEEG